LGTLAGHRDGCNTECPGDKVYVQAEAIRECVSLRLSALETWDQHNRAFRLIQEGNMLQIHSLCPEFEVALYSTDGRLVETAKGSAGSLSMRISTPALYYVQLNGSHGVQYQKLIAP
jgi:hypothetical protein